MLPSDSNNTEVQAKDTSENDKLEQESNALVNNQLDHIETKETFQVNQVKEEVQPQKLEEAKSEMEISKEVVPAEIPAVEEEKEEVSYE